ADRFDPVSEAILSFFPMPTPGRESSTGAGNFLGESINESISHQINTRLDHQLSQNSKLFVRFTHQKTDVTQIGLNKDAPGTDPFWAAFPNLINANTSAGWDVTVRSSLLSQTYVTYTNRPWRTVNPGFGLSWPRQLGLTGADPDEHFPYITIPGYQSLGQQTGRANQHHMDAYNLSQKVSYVRGRHNLKTGVEVMHSTPSFRFRGSPSGTLNYGPIGPGTGVAGGNALAAFLLGFVSSASIADQPQKDFTTTYYSVWVQDDWRVRPNLTLNLGLRWGMDTAARFENDILSGFDPDAINPVSSTPGVVTFASTGTHPGILYDTESNFSPRLGFAWQPFGSGTRTVIRGGGALIYETPVQQAAGSWQSPTAGEEITARFNSGDNGVTPAFYLRDGFPPIPPGELKSPAFGAVPVGDSPRFGVTYFDPDDRFPYSYHTSLEVQHELPTQIVASIGYIGTFGRNLRLHGLSENQLEPEQFGPGDAQVRRPYPQFSDVTHHNAPIVTSSYHGMELKAQKRFSDGFQFSANYVWSKMLDDRNFFRSVYLRELNRGPSVSDLRHRFVFSGVFEIPAGPGKRFLETGVLSQVLGGWSLGAIVTFQMGLPLKIGNALGPGCNCFADQGVDLVGDPKLPRGERSMDRWFNTDAFAPPRENPYRFGTAGSGGMVYGPGRRDFDLSVWKSFRLGERYRLHFRSDLINVLNHSNLSNPDITLGSGGFGGIFQKVGNRQIQLGLKFEF
ncbi:MAG: TonB-dependent receptor domain-containing protein, partial [Acidobacteriota bacterium]